MTSPWLKWGMCVHFSAYVLFQKVEPHKSLNFSNRRSLISISLCELFHTQTHIARAQTYIYIYIYVYIYMQIHIYAYILYAVHLLVLWVSNVFIIPQYINTYFNKVAANWQIFSNAWPLMKLFYLLMDLSEHKSLLVQVLNWHCGCDKPSCEPMMTRFTDASPNHNV